MVNNKNSENKDSHHRDGISCKAVESLLSEHIDNYLTQAERASVDEHLNSCENCADLYQDCYNLVSTARSLREVELTEGTRYRLREHLRRETGFAPSENAFCKVLPFPRED